MTANMLQAKHIQVMRTLLLFLSFFYRQERISLKAGLSPHFSFYWKKKKKSVTALNLIHLIEIIRQKTVVS